MKTLIFLLSISLSFFSFAANDSGEMKEDFNTIINEIATTKGKLSPDAIDKFQTAFYQSCLQGAKEKELQIYADQKYSKAEKKKIWATVDKHCQCISKNEELSQAFIALAKGTKLKDSNDKTLEDNFMKSLKGAQEGCFASASKDVVQSQGKTKN